MLKHGFISLLGLALLVWAILWAPPLSADVATGKRPSVVVLEVDGAIGPASDDFIVRGIENAERGQADLIVLRLNTPGGLDTSMRDIIRKILASTVPIATYVSPPGSRAASAGTYILYASHIAAMAPATNLGSATPVNLSPPGFGDKPRPGQAPAPQDSSGQDYDRKQPSQTDRDQKKTEQKDRESNDRTENNNVKEAYPESPTLSTAMERKVINDAVAYIKGLARLRGRNEQWAEDAVRDAVNLTAEDALLQNVIDLVATDLNDLLSQVDGRSIKLQIGDVTLSTLNAQIDTIRPDWRTRFLEVITNPNVAYILILLGVYGLFFELSNPGSIFPGVIGGICLLLALYAFQVLPVNYAGLALILLGIAFMVGELFIPSFGVLGIGGVIAFVFGSLILMDSEIPAYQISIPLIVAITAVTALFVGTLIRLAIRQRKIPVSTGVEQMIGARGTVVTDFDDAGIIHIHGENWSANSSTPLRKGQRVRVRSMDGLVLDVEAIEENQ